MKTLIAFVLFICFYFFSQAQSFAVINDKDGFVNVRKDKSINAAITGQIHNDDIFGYDSDEKSEWVKIYKESRDKNALEGYIHKSRIFPLSKFRSLKNIYFYNDSCVAINDSLTIIIKSSSFNVKKHKLTYDKTYPKELTKIDAHHIWGTDGNTPKKVISTVNIIKNNTSIIIPKNAFNDLYEPSFRTLKIYAGIENTIYIEMDNSDGAGAYTIIWIIKTNQYLKRYIDNSVV